MSREFTCTMPFFRLLISRFILLLFLVPGIGPVYSQVIVSGKIYDAREHIILPGVSVERLHSRDGLQSDGHGRYYLHANAGDTLMFSYLGYAPRKLVIPDRTEVYSEDIYLLPKEFSLPGVNVMALRDYHKDSVENRSSNAELFDYHQRSAGSKFMEEVLEPLGIKQTFHRAHHLNTKSRFQDKLIDQEQQNYINQHYTRQLVSSLTGLTGKELNDFMQQYRPSYDFLINASEYEFLEQITRHYAYYHPALVQDPPAGKDK